MSSEGEGSHGHKVNPDAMRRGMDVDGRGERHAMSLPKRKALDEAQADLADAHAEDIPDPELADEVRAFAQRKRTQATLGFTEYLPADVPESERSTEN